jgi:hypothetical protein
VVQHRLKRQRIKRIPPAIAGKSSPAAFSDRLKTLRGYSHPSIFHPMRVTTATAIALRGFQNQAPSYLC